MRRSDLRALCHRFLSTPSARRATLQDCAQIYWLCISIHALREEGDFTEMPQTLAELQFLSTPSARRATQSCTLNLPCHENFYPRPPRGGRQEVFVLGEVTVSISIHALREEGDARSRAQGGRLEISIHALREEGDQTSSDG